MKIQKLELRHFGKFRGRTILLGDGIQLLGGENEAGKTTVHTFIKSMLFGMERGRGRAVRALGRGRFLRGSHRVQLRGKDLSAGAKI